MTGAPDGVYRHVVTYFTRDREPGYFAADERLQQRKREREQALHDFVASLP